MPSLELPAERDPREIRFVAKDEALVAKIAAEIRFRVYESDDVSESSHQEAAIDAARNVLQLTRNEGG